MSPVPPKAPDDSGAFGMLGSEQKRIVEGATYWVGARIAEEKRSPEQWSISLLLNIHRKLFSSVFPEHAGKLRLKDVIFRSHIIPAPGQIQYRLTDIVKDARHIIAQARTIGDREERIQTILPQISRFHADCVVIQPFIDGNKRWARQVLFALLVDCGFWPGSRIDVNDRERYMDGIDKSVAGNHDQLATLVLEGWVRLEEDFSSGSY
jgi:fido (protein-threonine AMPylation protein)